jgi:hypothetical protein
MGRTVTALAAGSHDLVDRVNAFEVRLIHPGLTLVDADNDALLAGANLALVGDEAIQFGRAEPLGSGRWRLFDLWRGRRGTEWAITTHAIDSSFVLIESIALSRLGDSAAVGNLRVMAVGVGDSTGVVAQGPALVGAAVRPLAPTHLIATSLGGDMVIGWTRRSRDGWRWRDAVDVPIGEESERYRVTKTVTGRPDVVVDVASPAWTYSAAERAADFGAGATLATVSVVQIGVLGVSRPATLIVPTN